MKTIPLTQGRFAIVDDEDYEWLKKWKWRVDQGPYTPYAIANIKVSKCRQSTKKMHRVILGLQLGDKRQCDHIDGDGLNNQRSNLRICTSQQNNRCSRKRTICTSKYKGVHWRIHEHKWRAQICINRKQIHLGYFDSEIDAAAAYNQAALSYFSDFALINKIS